MTPDEIIISCDLRRRIAQLESFAGHAELQAVIPPAHIVHVELFTEDMLAQARDLRARISQLRDELQDVEGQQRLRFSQFPQQRGDALVCG